jgi:hypothetical protein
VSGVGAAGQSAHKNAVYLDVYRIATLEFAATHCWDGPNFWARRCIDVDPVIVGHASSPARQKISRGGRPSQDGRDRDQPESDETYSRAHAKAGQRLRKAYRVTQMGGSCAFAHGHNIKILCPVRFGGQCFFVSIQKSIGLFLLTFLRYGAGNKGGRMSSIRSNRRSNFGITCGQCGHELIAPEWSEYRNEQHVHHVWR